MKHDLVTQTGRILDGGGTDEFHGDVAVYSDAITGLDEVPELFREIDAARAPAYSRSQSLDVRSGKPYRLTIHAKRLCHRAAR